MVPGLNGYLNGYYHKCIDMVRHLVTAFDSTCIHASFLKEMLETNVIIIYEPGKVPGRAESYRPIFLLNKNLKMFSVVMSNRISTIKNSLISPDQVGFMLNKEARDFKMSR